MVFSKLSEKIKQEMDSGDFSLQVIFRRNIEAIEYLHTEGYTYRTIFKKLDTGLHEKHWRDLIRRAKEQNNSKFMSVNKSNVKTDDTSILLSDYSPRINDESIEEWMNYLGYEISERVYNKIVDLNLTTSKINTSKVPNPRRLIIFLSELSEKIKHR